MMGAGGGGGVGSGGIIVMAASVNQVKAVAPKSATYWVGKKRSTTRPGLSPLSSFPNFPSYAIILNLGKNAATLPCRLIKKRCAYVCQPNQHT